MSGSGNEEHHGPWERVSGDMSPGSPQYVQLSEPEAREPKKVMSANPNDCILTEVIAPCLTCGNESHEPVVCIGCGSYGHTSCLSLEYFKGYPWCVACFAKTAQAFAQMQDGIFREQWIRTLPEQNNFWKLIAKESTT